MASFSLREIAGLTGGSLAGDGERVISRLLTDTRQLANTDEALFVAIRGERHDGHHYLEEAYASGLRNFLVQEGFGTPPWEEAAWIAVPDPLTAIQVLAARHRERFRIPVMAITGSNGKTILKEWLFQILQGKINLLRSPRSYNSQLGVPLSLWMLNAEHEMAIFEAGISRPGEMQKLAQVIRPTLGVLTNILDAHQENFNSREEKTFEKLRLFKDAEVFFYCADHHLVGRVIQQNPGIIRGEMVNWSASGPADLQVVSVDRQGARSSRIRGLYRGNEVETRIPFTDSASLENAIHAWLILLWLGYDPKWIAARMEELNPVAMRLELKKGINGCTLVNDSYNSDLVSLRIGLEYLAMQHQHRTKVLILSDILQSGLSEEVLYKEVSEMLLRYGVGEFIGIGPAIQNHRHLFPPASSFFPTTEDFLAQPGKLNFSDQAILLKGSREFRFEKITTRLEEKIHQTVLEINLNAMVHNLNHYRSLLPQGTKIMVMVKAFGYGSGSHEIASILQFHRVDYLAVAYTDEGIELREAGIHTPIMVMNPEEESLEAIIRYKLEPEIFSSRILEQFSRAVQSQGELQYPVHIKLDTGMHRLGFLPEEVEELTAGLKSQDLLRVKSVFSHLAASEDPAEDAFTRRQIHEFDRLSGILVSGLDYPVIRHILNSSGIERFPEAGFDMVRLGIGLYGISAGSQAPLQHVGTLKTTISQLKKLDAGETVGYNRAGKTGKGMTIAIVPLGYADGLDRRLSNGKGSLLVKGKLAPIVGNICMDMCMIDVTGLDTREGDEVIVFGESLPVSRLAGWLGTIPYEVLTGISARVKRIYFQE